MWKKKKIFLISFQRNDSIKISQWKKKLYMIENNNFFNCFSMKWLSINVKKKKYKRKKRIKRMIILIFSLNILSIKKIIWKKKQNKKRNKEEFKIEKIFLVFFFFSIKWLIFKNLIIF